MVLMPLGLFHPLVEAGTLAALHLRCNTTTAACNNFTVLSCTQDNCHHHHHNQLQPHHHLTTAVTFLYSQCVPHLDRSSNAICSRHLISTQVYRSTEHESVRVQYNIECGSWNGKSAIAESQVAHNLPPAIAFLMH